MTSERSGAATPAGIGTENESALHAAIKRWYARPGDQLEAPVDGYVVDIRRRDLLIEVQTGGFASIRPKLEALVARWPVHLLYPIPRERWIVKVDSEDGRRLSRRKSPKRGSLYDLFDELVRIPHLAGHPNLTLLAVMIQEEQLRCDDGRGSWRRKGVSIVDRRLLEVVEVATLRAQGDYAALLPGELARPFTNWELATCAKMPIRQARRMTYCLRKMGTLRRLGKRGREWLFGEPDERDGIA